MITQDRVYTAEDLWELSEQESSLHYELLRGRLIVMSPTGDKHGVLAMELGRLIANFVVEHDLGEVTAAETGYRPARNPDTVLAPDVGFISQAKLIPLTGKYYETAPDLAVEVVSPSDHADTLRQKISLYLQYGTRLVWVVYPDSLTIDVYETGHDMQSLHGDDLLDGGAVLPGFSHPVSEIFKRLRNQS